MINAEEESVKILTFNTDATWINLQTDVQYYKYPDAQEANNNFFFRFLID